MTPLALGSRRLDWKGVWCGWTWRSAILHTLESTLLPLPLPAAAARAVELLTHRLHFTHIFVPTGVLRLLTLLYNVP